MAKAKWTTKTSEVVLRAETDGGFYAEVPLYDNNVKQLTMRLTITADRAVTLFVHGEPAATMSGFQAWSDL
jgi:hypothetical protein